MLNFFRKVRKSLFNGGSTRKYLLYAAGEVLLVMVGILLALQVNNWNESRKQNIEELSLLKELKSELEYSMKELEITIVDNKQMLRGYRLIYDHLINDKPYVPILDSAFAYLDIWAQPYLSTLTYETIKNKGIDIIQNDSLKRHINEVYNLDIQSLVEDMIKWEWSFSQNTTQKMMVGNVRRNIDQNLATPNDFEGLKRDEEFLNFLSILIVIRDDDIDYNQRTKKAIEKLIQHINEELLSRRN